MASSLGIFIDQEIIKYAKITETKGTFRVDAFGYKYGEDQKAIIEKIIEETNSENDNIVVNAIDVHYEETNIFAMLKPKDYPAAIEIAYDDIMDKNKLNKELFEYGYILSPNIQDKEKLNVLIAYQDKTTMETRTNLLDKKNPPYSEMPIEISISNLYESGENALIVNMEEQTYLTTIIQKTPVKVRKVYEGISPLVDGISKVENSVVRAYEVIKNTVLPVDDMDKSAYESNDYLPIITSEITKVVGHIKKELTAYPGLVSKVYITGTGASISNIELFIEKLIDRNIEVSVLKPKVQMQNDGQLKEIIDVNSAIALAFEALGYERKYMGFRVKKTGGLSDMGSLDVSNFLTNDFKSPLDTNENFSLRVLLTVILVLAIFAVFGAYILDSNRKALAQVQKKTKEQQDIINTIKEDTSKAKTKTDEYTALIKKLTEKSNKNLTPDVNDKESIPNLLNNIANLIPSQVRISSISEERKHVKIVAQSYKYEQLGLFIGKLKVENVLQNIVSSRDQKENGIVQVTIEGDLL